MWLALKLEPIPRKRAGETSLDPEMAKYSVVRSQGHSDPFAMFIENVVQPGRDLTTASRISKINRIKVDYQAWVRAGSRQETGR